MSRALDLTGQRFGRLSILERGENDTRGNSQWKCVCDCGTTKIVRGYDIASGASKSCGCLRSVRLKLLNMKPGPKAGETGIDLTGQKFGRLVVLSRAENSKNNKTRWTCLCACGETKVVLTASLRDKDCQSCGCFRSDLMKGPSNRAFSHGGAETPEYSSWAAMKNRCASNLNQNYGGRGITVCDRLLGTDGFVNFLADMGPRPAGTSIDRINPNGNYELRNAKGELQCRWATAKEQSNNRRCSAKYKIKIREQQIAA